MTAGGSQQTDQRTMIFLGNRWVNTIYRNFGVIKQRILLQVMEQLQSTIMPQFKGNKITLPPGPVLTLELDISRIVSSHKNGFNNYYQVRKALEQMCGQEIDIYNDTSYKSFVKESFRSAPLLHGWKRSKDPKIVHIAIKRPIGELLVHIDYGYSAKLKKSTAQQFTTFDKETILRSSTKYMHPLYMLLCSYAERGGFTMSVPELRTRLQVDEKYAGFNDLDRKILRHVQRELEISGKWCFNFTTVKTGKVVKKLVFKIFPNKSAFDANHAWFKIQRALQQELPQFARITHEQREELNYLLTSKYDLNEVHDKIQYIHKVIVKKRGLGEKFSDVFVYLLTALHNDYPPPK